tara:strand:- start:35 stop:1162 length:1128 start_codon:yes stop_codon:yes gene_type:complete
MKTKIAFVIPNLLTGGTQRALVNIAQSLSTEDFEVALIVIHSATKKYGDLDTKRIPIDRDCLRVIYLDLNGVKWSIFKLRSLLMKEKPDILFSSLSYLNLYLSFFSFLLPKGIKLVIRETNVLSVKHSFTKYPRFINFIYKIGYKFAQIIVCQSNDMMEDLHKNFGIQKSKMKVINNPVNSEKIIKDSEIANIRFIKSDNINLVSVGHLTNQKGHDISIKAIKILKNENIILNILGRGPLRDYLEGLAEDLGVSNQIVFHGFQKNPFNYIYKSDIFIFPSRFEGFPNALLEAAVVGIPMIANNSKGGINEIINSKNGVIFDNSSEDLAKKINTIMQNEYNRESIRSDAIMRFDISFIGKKYTYFFKEIIRATKKS